MAKEAIDTEPTGKIIGGLLEKQYSRREIIRVGAQFLGFGLTLFTAKKALVSKLNEGIRLRPPGLELEYYDVDKDVLDPGMANAIVDEWGFFVKGRKLRYTHRTNSIEEIDRAFRENRTNLFDIDVRTRHGIVYGEHGIIFHQKMLGEEVKAVFDLNEVEFKTSLPPTFEDLVIHIHSLSTPDYPLAISIDLKDEFDKEELEEMIDILYKYKMPAYFLWDKEGSRFKINEIVEERKKSKKVKT